MVKTKRKDDKYKILNIILISCILLVILRKIIIAILGLTILINVIANTFILVIGLILLLLLIIYLIKRVYLVYLITGLLGITELITGLFGIITKDMLTFDAWGKLFYFFPLPVTLLLINYILTIIIIILSFYLWKKVAK